MLPRRAPIRVGSLCTGYGGIELGLALAGESIDLRWIAEFDQTLATAIYDGTDVPNLGDITAVDWSAVEHVDLLTAGFPCQPFSSAGAQLAENDPRYLWPAVRDAIAALRPDRVLLENVRNLISIRKGTVWQAILSDLAALGYDVTWLTLGACAIGAAHHRHRVFALAQRGDGDTRSAKRLDVEECGARRGSVMVAVGTMTDHRNSRNETAGRRQPDSAHHGGTTLGDFAVIVARGRARKHRPDDRDRGGAGQGVRKSAVGLALLPSPTAQDGSSEPGHASAAEGSPDLRTVTSLLPSPRATVDPVGGPGQRGSSGDLAMPSAVQPQHWGRFADAVARHAAVFGPPPAPTEPNRNGAPRLAPTFAEWLMCIPAGHVTGALPRGAALKAIGNGVCPPQLAQAWRYLTDPDAQPLDTSIGRALPSATMTSSTSTTSADVKEIQDRQAAGRGAVLDAASAEHLEPAERIQAAMMALVEHWRAEADIWEAGKKRGSVGTAKEIRAAASRLAGFAVGLTTRPVQFPGDEPCTHPAEVLSTRKDGSTLCTRCRSVVTLDETFTSADAASIIAAALPVGDPVREAFAAYGEALGELVLDASQVLATALGPRLPGDPGYREAEHARPAAPCFECIDVANNEDPTPWCDCRGDETCKGPCRKFAHVPTFHAVHPPQCPCGRPACAALSLTPDQTPEQSLRDIIGPLGASSVAATIDHPFTSPSVPWLNNKRPVERLGFQQLPIIATDAAGARDHVSHSYCETYESCSLAALLRDASRHGHVGAQRPGWSQVGGSAFHSAVEAVERAALAGLVLTEPEAIWSSAFDTAVKTKLDELVGTPYADSATWYVSNRGKEGFDWWRVEGARMLKLYLDYHSPAWRAANQVFRVADTTPVIEYPYEMTLRSLDGERGLTAQGYIDIAHLDMTTYSLTVRDYKTGARDPESTFQLGEYGHALLFAMGIPNEPADRPILGSYWLARKGIYTDPVPVLQRHPLPELQYRYDAAMRGTAAKIFAPHTSNLCKSCSAVDYCPTQGARS